MWKMEMCVGKDEELILKEFETPGQWRTWLRENHPNLLTNWHDEGVGWVQYGTGYYWSELRKMDKQDQGDVGNG